MGSGSMQHNWKSSIYSQPADLGSETGKHCNCDQTDSTLICGNCLNNVLQVSRVSNGAKVFGLYVIVSSVFGLVQQASDTKDGGSKIMESLSSMDEGDQQVVTPFWLPTSLPCAALQESCICTHAAAMLHIGNCFHTSASSLTTLCCSAPPACAWAPCTEGSCQINILTMSSLESRPSLPLANLKQGRNVYQQLLGCFQGFQPNPNDPTRFFQGPPDNGNQVMRCCQIIYCCSWLSSATNQTSSFAYGCRISFQ